MSELPIFFLVTVTRKTRTYVHFVLELLERTFFREGQTDVDVFTCI